MRFTLPSIGTMIFTSIYGVVDGFFVSNFAGKTPFAAVNLIMPFLIIIGTVGYMFGSGGTAVVSKTFGEGDPEKANRYFSLFIYFAAALGVFFAVLGIIFIRPISVLLGRRARCLKTALSMRASFLRRCRFISCSLSFRASLWQPRNHRLVSW